ncbi:type IV pilus modification PilV family protein [Paenibacillus sp. VTT E-133280]|uniref:type IV pilus modification PilV family protein n=1 Tax=Paenibacillus sp. VTT E-133280 TaxID=1986222 RepID=UPI00211B1FF3|nr:type II secretion system protein [Paenibacillus sp. VTT E-133280]
MKSGLKQENGFTLIEVLAAIVILSIVSLVLTSYFTNAMSYSKSNQNKTIMVNLARNALFYVEKQDFEKMSDYFITDPVEHQKLLEDGKGVPLIGASECTTQLRCVYNDIFVNSKSLPDVLNPVINNIEYKINIRYQFQLHQEMRLGKDDSGVVDQRKVEMAPYLIPVEVEVSGNGGPGGKAYKTVVEGYITDEKIR